tara:strand:+ start:4300 stop:4548 length:249 start_codon:yes stop_codon:yes gene_type:complete
MSDKQTIEVSEKSPEQSSEQSSNPPVAKEGQEINLLNLPVENQNDALNVMLGFLGLAQKRGCFAINESAKIYDCVKMFQNSN